MTAVRAPLLAAGGAALAILAFPPFDWWPAAFVMAAPLAILACRENAGRAFAWTWLSQVAMGLGIVHWLVRVVVVEYSGRALSAWAFTLLLVGGYALAPATAVALFARWRKRCVPWAEALVFAALFTASEWLRASPLGLPWLLAGQTVAFVPPLIQAAAWGGVLAVGFPLTALGAGLGVALHRRSGRPLALPALLALSVPALGGLRLATDSASAGSLEVGLVQASIPVKERWRPGSAARSQAIQAGLTERLLAEGPVDLVVWPETAIDGNLDEEPGLGRAMTRLADEIRAPVVTGARRGIGTHVHNSVVVFVPGVGRKAAYDKRRLVPFAESDPPYLGWLAPLLGRVTVGAAYEPGTGPRVLHIAGTTVGTPICFEITYPDDLRRVRKEGARLLLNLSNDAWFGKTGFSRLHLAHAVFRAVELGVPVVRAANAGISAVIDASGRFRASTRLFERVTLRVRVPRATRTTFFERYGDAPFLLLLVLGLMVGLRRHPKR